MNDDKQKILLCGATQEFVNNTALLNNYKILAICENEPEKQGRILNYKDEILFTIKLEESSKFDYDLIIAAVPDLSPSNVILQKLLTTNLVDHRKLRVIFNGDLIGITKTLNTADEIMSEKRPKLFVDVSSISQRDAKTGVQRVVRNIFSNMHSIINDDVMAVQWSQTSMATSRKFERYLQNKENDYTEYRLKFEPGDKILILDAIWCGPHNYEYLTEETTKGNLKTYTVIYDLIPIRSYSELIKSYNPFIEFALKSSNAIICISKTVSEEIAEYYNEHKLQRDKPLEIYYFHLGFEMETKVGTVRDEIKNFVNKSTTFLMVGTLLSHKNYVTVLKTFQKIIDQNPEESMQLLIIGKNGWDNQEFINLYASDNRFKDRVLWIQNGSDEELQWAYQNCEAFIFASLIEGYGLPIAEAAHFGLPIICSDIPIFHEVAGDNAIYFSPLDVEMLKNILLDWNNLKNTVDSSKIKLYTWRECAQEILDIIDDKVEPYKILD